MKAWKYHISYISSYYTVLQLFNSQMKLNTNKPQPQIYRETRALLNLNLYYKKKYLNYLQMNDFIWIKVVYTTSKLPKCNLPTLVLGVIFREMKYSIKSVVCILSNLTTTTLCFLKSVTHFSELVCRVL